MTFLPIVERELRVASRRRATYWSRSVSALMAIGLGILTYLLHWGQTPQELGVYLFEAIAFISFLFCLLCGVLLTSDCLSEEKREGTLGLLFLTDLRSYDIVLGKLAATSLGGFYGLLAIFPVLAVPLLLGGLTQGELWRMILVLANAFLLSLATGIFISSVSRNPFKAMAGTFSVLALFSGMIPAFALWGGARSHPLGFAIFYLTPPAAFDCAFDGTYQAQFTEFWRSMGVMLGLALVLISLACLIVPRSWRDKASAVPTAGWRAFWREWKFGDAADRAAFRKQLLDVNAFYWLAARARWKPVCVWMFLVVGGGVWSCGWWEWRKEWFDPGVYLFTALVLNTVLKVWITWEAGQQLAEDRKMGALELLLSTPLKEADIMRGQFFALQRQFLGPVLAVIAIEIIFLLASTRDSSFDASGVEFCLASLAVLVADMIALSSVGMWVALNAKKPSHVAAGTLLRVVIIPNSAFVIFSIVIGALTRGSGLDGSVTVMLWFVLRMINDILVTLNARSRLQSNLRRIAMERFMPSGSRFRRWFAPAD